MDRNSERSTHVSDMFDISPENLMLPIATLMKFERAWDVASYF